MEHLELGEKRETITRLAVCVVIAVGLYLGGEKLCTALKLPLWETYGPWLERNKLQSIAVVAAVIFGISLVVAPLKHGETEPCGECDEEEDFIPCT